MYEIELRFLDQAYRDIWTCHFVNNNVRITTTRNIWITPGLSSALLLPPLMGMIHDGDMWIGQAAQNPSTKHQ